MGKYTVFAKYQVPGYERVWISTKNKKKMIFDDWVLVAMEIEWNRILLQLAQFVVKKLETETKKNLTHFRLQLQGKFCLGCKVCSIDLNDRKDTIPGCAELPGLKTGAIKTLKGALCILYSALRKCALKSKPSA